MFNSPERYYAPRCSPGTRVNVMKHTRRWFEDVQDHPICWIRGGSASSAIAQTIAEEYGADGKLAASFFFDQQSDHQQGIITDFVPTIIYQLSIMVPATRRFMIEAFKRDPSIPENDSQYQLQKLIVEPLLELGSAVSLKIVVIDGLDQDDGESWVEDLIILLAGVCQNDQLPLRFCLTNRADSRIRSIFEATGTKRSRCKLYSLTLEDFEVHNDGGDSQPQPRPQVDDDQLCAASANSEEVRGCGLQTLP